jgi:hypothetical protein
MKKLILSVTAVAGLALAGTAQQVQFADSGTANGSIDTAINGAPNTSQDLNLELLVGSSSTTVTTDVVTLLLNGASATATTALGTVQPGAGDITGTGGDILDKTINFYAIPANDTYYQVLAWTGSYSTYAAAVAAYNGNVLGAGYGSSAVLAFSPPPALNTVVSEDLDPNQLNVSVVTTVVPEPTTLAMAGVGLASMLIFRRKNK